MVDSDEDIVRPHSHDGIQEYDNRLPLWLTWTFYGCIVFSFLYMSYFHLGGPGKLGPERLERELEIARQELLERGGGLPATEEQAREFLSDVARIRDGAQVFQTAGCTSCHGPDAAGASCPNLRDDYWINGNQVTEIIDVIAKGRNNNGPYGNMTAHYDPDNNIMTLSPDAVLNVSLWIVNQNQLLPTAEGDGLATTAADRLQPIDYHTPVEVD